MHIFDVGVADALGDCGSDFFVVFAVFRDGGGIVVEIEFEAETAGLDSCAMRAMDGVSSLAALPGL